MRRFAAVYRGRAAAASSGRITRRRRGAGSTQGRRAPVGVVPDAGGQAARGRQLHARGGQHVQLVAHERLRARARAHVASR